MIITLSLSRASHGVSHCIGIGPNYDVIRAQTLAYHAQHERDIDQRDEHEVNRLQPHGHGPATTAVQDNTFHQGVSNNDNTILTIPAVQGN